MPLPLPNLDNRTYADLIEGARALIPSEYATWTDQNPTDPGIVLLELFAWLTEMVLYRVDQVTDDNIETFLQLLNGPGWEQSEGTLDAAIQQTILDLRKRYRAVSVEDFEQLVLEDWNQSQEASTLGDAGKVARVKCLPQSNLNASRSCLSFDGVDDYVACENNLGELSELTLEIWVNPGNNYEVYDSIFSSSNDTRKENSFQIDFNEDSQYRLNHSAERISLCSIIIGEWQHFVISFNHDNELRIYINGREVMLLSDNSIESFCLEVLLLGKSRNSNKDECLQGLLADFRLWNYARSVDEIQSNMNRRLTGREDGLLVYWPLDEADGTTVLDCTQNGNRGTISGDAAWAYSGDLPLSSSQQQNSAVDLVIIPEQPQSYPTTALKRSLWTFLDQRRLLTTRHHIVGPTYVPVTITATLHLQAGAVADTVREQAIHTIRGFFDPLLGGTEGTGWPFGRAVYRSEVYEVLDQVSGVDYVGTVALRGDKAATQVPLQPHELVNVIIDRASLTIN